MGRDGVLIVYSKEAHCPVLVDVSRLWDETVMIFGANCAGHRFIATGAPQEIVLIRTARHCRGFV